MRICVSGVGYDGYCVPKDTKQLLANRMTAVLDDVAAKVYTRDLFGRIKLQYQK